MGVDVSLKIRVIKDIDESIIEITEIDNAFEAIFWADEILGTNYNFKISEILTQDEIELFKFIDEGQSESFSHSLIVSSQLIKVAIDKIHQRMYYPSMKNLTNDLAHIVKSKSNLNIDLLQSEIYNCLIDYIGFYESLNRFKAIVDLAAKQNTKMQIIKEYY